MFLLWQFVSTKFESQMHGHVCACACMCGSVGVPGTTHVCHLMKSHQESFVKQFVVLLGVPVSRLVSRHGPVDDSAGVPACPRRRPELQTLMQFDYLSCSADHGPMVCVLCSLGSGLDQVG